jgi:hypothetical protein
MATSEMVQTTGKDLLDNITKALTLFVSITYIMGLIIVNSYLLTFGVRTTTLLSVEYISAGLPLTLLFVVAGLTGGFFNRPEQTRSARIIVLVLSTLILSLMMLYITNLEDYPRTLRTTGIIFMILFLVFFAIIRDFSRRLFGSREKLVVWSGVYGLLLVAMVVALSTWYGRAVYDDILPTIGGGAGSTISLITDAENGVVLGELVPMSSKLQSEQIRLIRETNDSYLITRTDETSVSVDKDLVKGVIHHKVSGWEVTPSILD